MVSNALAAEWKAEAVKALAACLDRNEAAARLAAIVIALVEDRADLCRWVQLDGRKAAHA